jgi:16S rRNA G966 N2-methylase RsmD
MHIGTGKYQGKKLKDSHDGAPISTRVLTAKESIFEVIGKRIHESSVLDINDKNGMYGIEALSKGAATVQFINLHKNEQKLIKENLESIECDPKDHIIEGDPQEFFERDLRARFDLIFFRAVDNHCLSMLKKVLKFQEGSGMTIVIYPHSNDCELDEAPDGYNIFERREVETEKVAIILKDK